MILHLLAALFPLFVLVVLSIPVYAIFWGIKKWRYSLMPAAIGIKAAPLGCMSSIIFCLLICLILSVFALSGWIFSVIIILSITVGLVFVWKMTSYFYSKAEAEQEAHPEIQYPKPPKQDGKLGFAMGIFFFCLALPTPIPSAFIFSVWVRPFCVHYCHLNWTDPVEIPLRNIPGVEATISLTDYPIGFIPGNESAFILVVENKDGNVIRFPHFIINCGSHYELPVHHIAGKTTGDHGWLQFSNDGGQLQYLNLNSLKLTDELPSEFEKSSRKFIGIYERGKVDTNAKDPMLK